MLGRGKEDLKSSETGLSGDISGKLNVFMTDSNEGSELSYEGLVQEEKVEEIMQELYKEMTLATSSSNTSPPTSVAVTFPSLSLSLSLSSSSSSLLSSLTFFPVNDVKISESCGASMSDSSSTVMAGIEFVGPTRRMPGVKGGSSEKELWIMDTGFEFDGEYDNNKAVIIAGGGKGETGRMEVDEDQWLARVLGWGPRPLEPEESMHLN
ncbi:hypothetical protein V6N13_098079 [Hibiscus sabdariffa]